MGWDGMEEDLHLDLDNVKLQEEAEYVWVLYCLGSPIPYSPLDCNLILWAHFQASNGIEGRN